MKYRMYELVTIPQITLWEKFCLLFVKGYWTYDEDERASVSHFVKYFGNKMYVLETKTVLTSTPVPE